MLKQKKPQLVIRQHHPLLIRILVITAIALFVVAGYILFEYGRKRAGFDYQAARQADQRKQDVIDSLRKEISKLHRANAKLESARAIDGQANKSVKGLLAKMQQDQLELREELQFYRSIVSPQKGRPGVHIQHFKLDQAQGEGAFRYRLTLIHVQALKQHRRKVWGRIQMSITGVRGQQQQELTLAQVSKPKRDKIRFGFKYYKHFEGGMQIPAGFTPDKVVIKVLTGRGKLMTKKTFKWPEISG